MVQESERIATSHSSADSCGLGGIHMAPSIQANRTLIIQQFGCIVLTCDIQYMTETAKPSNMGGTSLLWCSS